MWEKIKEEPAVAISFIAAVIALAIGFGLDITTEQVGLIMAPIAIALGFFTRSQVSPKQ